MTPEGELQCRRRTRLREWPAGWQGFRIGVDISETYAGNSTKVDEARSTVCGMTSSHIVAGARTPIGKMSGAFSTTVTPNSAQLRLLVR